jgi:putative two-component system response regulator
MLQKKDILFIYDDPQSSREVRDKLLAEGYGVTYVSNSREGLDAFKENRFDIIILKMDKLVAEIQPFLKEAKAVDPDCIIILAAESGAESLPQELQLAIYDTLPIPLNSDVVLFLVRKGLDLRSSSVAHRRMNQILHEQNNVLQKQNTLLARRIEESTKNLTKLYEDLRTTYMRTIKVLAQAIDARDHYTHSHSEKVSEYATAIAAEMHLSAKEIEMIREACELHDLGKIGVEDNILGKPTSLTPEEWEQIRQHPITAAQILEPLTFLNGVITMVKQHHEHFDGTGYPEGRKAEDIDMGARIIHVADAYEAMTSARSYRKTPLSKEQAVQEIKKHSGTQFDPRIVEVFLRVVDTF